MTLDLVDTKLSIDFMMDTHEIIDMTYSNQLPSINVNEEI
jgi:hypothetical protein